MVRVASGAQLACASLVLLHLAACAQASREAPAGAPGAGGAAGSTGPDLDPSGGAGGATCAPGGPDDDMDGDGYTPSTGDCQECEAHVNPGAIEVITEGTDVPADEDCDGLTDEDDALPCDEGLAIDEAAADLAARALGICRLAASPGDWGLVSARWTLADGSDPPAGFEAAFHRGHGVLPSFGPVVQPREGARLLALSSGTARAPDDPGYIDVDGYDKGFLSVAPQGFPKESPACPGVLTGLPHDAAGLELVMRAPSNAHGLAFDFHFFTHEWPGWVCTEYNDFFVALLEPVPLDQSDGNISFDDDGNSISVNSALLEMCGCAGNPPAACSAGGKSYSCALGDAGLHGTGFGPDTGIDMGQPHGGTGWLRTEAPVEAGGELTLRFTVYDSGDGVLDSTTLIDAFRWRAEAGEAGTQPVPD